MPIFFAYKKQQRSSPRPLFPFPSISHLPRFLPGISSMCAALNSMVMCPLSSPPPFSSGRAEPNFLTWSTRESPKQIKKPSFPRVGTVETFGENLRPIPLFPGHIGVCSGPPPSFAAWIVVRKKKVFFILLQGGGDGKENYFSSSLRTSGQDEKS